jgi:DNA-directed RNA polymerase subunit RPC12/RpoP
MRKRCDRCGKELRGNVALFSVNNKLPSEGRAYACWECLTQDERIRHMRGGEAEPPIFDDERGRYYE